MPGELDGIGLDRWLRDKRPLFLSFSRRASANWTLWGAKGCGGGDHVGSWQRRWNALPHEKSFRIVLLKQCVGAHRCLECGVRLSCSTGAVRSRPQWHALRTSDGVAPHRARKLRLKWERSLNPAS